MGGAVITPGVPGPKTQKRWKRTIILPIPTHTSITASAWEDESGEGSLVWDVQPSPPRKHHKHHKSKKSLSAEDLRFLGPTSIPESQLVANNVPSSFVDVTFLLAPRPLAIALTSVPESWASLITTKRLRLSAPARMWQQHKPSKQLERFRIELKRDPKLQSFIFSKQNSKYGKLDLAYAQGSRIALSVMTKEPLWNLTMARFQRMLQKQEPKLDQHSLRKTRHELRNSARHDAKRRSSATGDGNRKRQGKRIQKRGSTSRTISTEATSLDSSESVLARNRAQLRRAQKQHVQRQMQRAQGRMEKRNVSVKSDLEYNLKEKIVGVSAAVEAYRASFSIRSRINPLRITPRIQIPLAYGAQDMPWISWTRGSGSGFGEVQLGKRGLEVSADWHNQMLSLKQKGSNGGSTVISLNNNKKIATIDKTVITQPLLGAFTLTLIAHMTTAENKGNTLTATVTSPFGAISASAASTRAVNMLADLNIDLGRRAYTIGLKVEEAKNFAVRIGFHM